MVDWLLEGISGAEFVRGVFHAFAVFAYVKVLFQERRIKELEERLSRMERKTIWK